MDIKYEWPQIPNAGGTNVDWAAKEPASPLSLFLWRTFSAAAATES